MRTLMKLWAVRTLLALTLLSIGYTFGHYSTAVVHAQQPTQVGIPKAWGPIIGTMTGILILQDRTGTIRLVAADTGVVGEVITRD